MLLDRFCLQAFIVWKTSDLLLLPYPTVSEAERRLNKTNLYAICGLEPPLGLLLPSASSLHPSALVSITHLHLLQSIPLRPNMQLGLRLVLVRITLPHEIGNVNFINSPMNVFFDISIHRRAK